MRRVIVFLLLCCFAGCVAPRQMQFIERDAFPVRSLDSVLVSNELPDLDKWKRSSYFTASKSLYHQWTYVKQVYSKTADEAIYVIEDRDSLFLFVHRRVFRVKQ